MSKPDKDPKGPKPHSKPTPEPIPEPATAVDIDGVVMYTRHRCPQCDTTLVDRPGDRCVTCQLTKGAQ